MFSGGEVKNIQESICATDKFKAGAEKDQCEASVQGCVAASDEGTCTTENIDSNAAAIKLALLEAGDSVSKAAKDNFDNFVTKVKGIVKGSADAAPAKPIKPKKPQDEDEAESDDPTEVVSKTKTSIDPKACSKYIGTKKEQKLEYAQCLQVIKTVKAFCDTKPKDRGIGDDEEEVNEKMSSYQCSEANKEGQLDSDLRNALLAWEEEGAVNVRADLLLSQKRMRKIVKETLALEVPEDQDAITSALAAIEKSGTDKEENRDLLAAALKEAMALPHSEKFFDNEFKDYAYTISEETDHPVKRVGFMLRGAFGVSPGIGLLSEANDSSHNETSTVPDEANCSDGSCSPDSPSSGGSGDINGTPSEWKSSFPFGGDIGAVIRLPEERLGLIAAFGYRRSNLDALDPQTTDLLVQDIHLDVGLTVQLSKVWYLGLEAGPGYRWIEATEKKKAEEISDGAGQKLKTGDADLDNWSVHAMFFGGAKLAGPFSVELGLEWTNMLNSVDKKGRDANNEKIKAKLIPADGKEGLGNISVMVMPTLTF